MRNFQELQGHQDSVVQSAGVYLHADSIRMLSAYQRVCWGINLKYVCQVIPTSYCFRMLSSVPVDHYVLSKHSRDPYYERCKRYISPSRAPCEMSDVLTNDKCRRQYRVSDLAVRTPN